MYSKIALLFVGAASIATAAGWSTPYEAQITALIAFNFAGYTP